MTNQKLFWLFALVMMIGSLSFTIACGDDDDDDDDDATVDDDATGDDDTTGDDDVAGECTAEAMCQFSVDCALGYESVEECLTASEAEIENCADADGFTACVCETFSADPTCVEYLGAGMTCYNQFCG